MNKWIKNIFKIEYRQYPIAKVWVAHRENRDVKLITVPHRCYIKDGDYVELRLV